MGFCLVLVFLIAGVDSFFHMSKSFTLDCLGFVFLLLTVFLFGVYMYYGLSENLGVAVLLFLLCVVLGFGFSGNSFFTYFIFFEVSLIPTAFLILGFGKNPERLGSMYYFLLYTSLASFPLLLKIISVWGESWDYFFLGGVSFSDSFETWWVSFFWGLAFLVKAPVFGGHLWLPKAHVEAPTVGSMILAAILLKLGILGLFRVVWVFPHNGFSCMLGGWLLLGILISSLVSFRSKDIKMFIAYSSVAHMGLVLLGFTSFSFSAFLGVVMVGVGHGLSSSGLFCFAGDYYKAVGGRKLLLGGKLVNLNPLFCVVLFVLCCVNASVPPSYPLFGEVGLFYSLLVFGKTPSSFMVLYVFLVGLYKIFLYLQVSHGTPKNMLLLGGGTNLFSVLNLFVMGCWGVFLFLCGSFWG